MKMEKNEFGNKTDFIGPYNNIYIYIYIFFFCGNKNRCK